MGKNVATVLIVSIVFFFFVRTVHAAGPVFGTLGTDPSHVPQQVSDGITVAQYSLYWDRFEPTEGQFSSTYIAQVKNDLTTMRSNGAQVVLDFGAHYPPAWLFTYSDSRYVNQYGDAFAPTEPGKKVANMVFNQVMRDKQANYLRRVFQELGTDFYAVRVGGGWYGELNYPDATYNGRANTYWGFDRNALGTANQRPNGIVPNPVSTWKPGNSSANHQSATAFINWYLNSLQNYQQWQIATVRSLYSGKIFVLYPSWGIRLGQLELAIQGDLSGQTSAEVNGEIQRGFDFSRFISGITDPQVVVYTTWLNADASGDSSTDQTRWSPVKFLSQLATQHQPPLAVAGENTGRDNYGSMTLTFNQVKQFGLIGLWWAFDQDLYATGSGFASYQQYVDLIRQQPSVCREDINRDGFVDLSDYSILSNNFLLSVIRNVDADINSDGIVDLSDYALLVRRFFQTC